jgi:hypothetical protein
MGPLSVTGSSQGIRNSSLTRHCEEQSDEANLARINIEAVITGLVLVSHVLVSCIRETKTWMAGSSPAMTE